MDYIKRELERKFLAMNQVFKAVMVTDAKHHVEIGIDAEQFFIDKRK